MPHQPRPLPYAGAGARVVRRDVRQLAVRDARQLASPCERRTPGRGVGNADGRRSIRAAVGKRRPDNEGGASTGCTRLPKSWEMRPQAEGKGSLPFRARIGAKYCFRQTETHPPYSLNAARPSGIFISLTPRQNGVLETVAYRAATRKKAVQSFLFTVIRLTTRS